MYVVFSLVVLLPSITPLSSKNLLYIQCSFVTGFNIIITLFCCLRFLTDRSILSKMFSSTSSSASSITQVLTLVRDFRLAVWSPDDVLIPLNIILLPERLFMISSFVMWKSSWIFKVSILSRNSGMIDIYADANVKRVNRIVCPAS